MITWARTSSSAAGFLLRPTRDVPLIYIRDRRNRNRDRDRDRGRDRDRIID
jgi:hypothetical protein